MEAHLETVCGGEEEWNEHTLRSSQTKNLQHYLIVHQELGAFEVARGHPHIVLLSRVVELSQTPVDKAQLQRGEKGSVKTQKDPGSDCWTSGIVTHLAVFVVNHHIVRLHVSMHDPHAVAVVQGLHTRGRGAKRDIVIWGSKWITPSQRICKQTD